MEPSQYKTSTIKEGLQNNLSYQEDNTQTRPLDDI